MDIPVVSHELGENKLKVSLGKQENLMLTPVDKNILHRNCWYKQYGMMLHLFDDLWLDKIIPKNNDEGRAIYGNLENKINTLYCPVENSIPKNNDRSRL